MDELEEFHKKAERKLKSSKLLYDAGDFANSLSLSYYAMLLMSKALLVKIGITTNKHFGIIKELSRTYVKTGKLDNETYKYLTKTQSLRNQSDYEAIDDITAEIAKEKINQAREFIDVTKELL
ncbi:MAG: HEPN domain-containing protein [Methanosphaera sp.]|nr:HEPN domain-containing protein [Methanosphaera sp.]